MWNQHISGTLPNHRANGDQASINYNNKPGEQKTEAFCYRKEDQKGNITESTKLE